MARPVEIEYSAVTGHKKTIKNVTVIFGLPQIVMFILGVFGITIPPENILVFEAGVGYVAYFVKNYIENSNILDRFKK